MQPARARVRQLLFNHTYTPTEFLGKFVSGGGGGASFHPSHQRGEKFLDGFDKPIKDKMTGDGEHGSGVLVTPLSALREKSFDGVINYVQIRPELGPAGDPAVVGAEHYRP